MADRTTLLVRRCNLVATGAIIGFLCGLAELFYPVNTQYNRLLVMTGVPLLLLSSCIFISAIVVRDRIAVGRSLWQFSLRCLLFLIAVVAALLGPFIYAAEK
jgi:hypothetical protein